MTGREWVRSVAGVVLGAIVAEIMMDALTLLYNRTAGMVLTFLLWLAVLAIYLSTVGEE